jgi:HD-like signal output (HDOD) protein
VDLRTIELKIARGENLPVLPQVVSTVFRVVGDPHSTARDLEKLIEQDPGLTAKVLRVVNSPAYGVSQINSVGRALAVLGVNRVRNLLVSVAFQNMISDRSKSTKFNKVEYWRHSLAVAVAARGLARVSMAYRAEELFLIGLFHDIGLIVMDKFCPEILDLVIRYAEVHNIPLDEAETKIGAFSHAQLGSILAAKWGFGESVKVTVAGHHDPSSLSTPNNGTAIVYVANRLAHESGFTNQMPKVSIQVDEAMLKAIDVTTDQLEVVRSEMTQEVEKAQRTFSLKVSHAAQSPTSTRLSPAA